MRMTLCLVALMTAAMTSACTTPVHEDYPQYLVSNYGLIKLPKVEEPVRYYLSTDTENHSYSIRSARAGLYLNNWVVDFGRIMDSTMNGPDVRAAFGTVEKTATPYDHDGLLVIFDLTNYQFAGFEARVNLRIDARESGREILSKTYSARGRRQSRKVFWGGSFAMKDAVQQSTKNAVDKIMTEFILDLNQAVEVARLKEPDVYDYPSAGQETTGGGSPSGDRNRARSGEERVWRSPGGETIIWNDPDRSASTHDGTATSLEYCREYQSMVTIDGRFEETYGTACLQPDGSWRIIE